MQEPVTFTHKNKIVYSYSDPGRTFLNNLKPLFSRNKELYISKEVKENALSSEIMPTRKDNKPQKINMHITTSQYEISDKNHISSVKTFFLTIRTRQRKHSLEQAAFWHEVVVCCLPTPFLH